MVIEYFSIEEMASYKAMFSCPILLENARVQLPLKPNRDFDFILERNNFDEWLRIWKMTVPFASKFKADLMKFA